jgi:hypothetical protein
LTKINMGTTAIAMRPKVTQLTISVGDLALVLETYNPIIGLVLICVFMPYDMACPMASIHLNAAPFLTLAVM